MKALFFIAAAVLAASYVFASIDTECQANGFDYGIVKFEWADGAYYPEDPAIGGFEINLTDDSYEADWTSNMYVAGLVVFAGGETTAYPGGISGTVYGFETTNPVGHPITLEISHITFCGWSKSGGQPPVNGVPEFSTITLAIAVIGGALGMAVMRKR